LGGGKGNGKYCPPKGGYEKRKGGEFSNILRDLEGEGDKRRQRKTLKKFKGRTPSTQGPGG